MIKTAAILIALAVIGTGCLSKTTVSPVAPPFSEPAVRPITSLGSIGIGNAKVLVGKEKGYYPGARVEYTLPIYNNYPEDVQVMLLLESPSNPEAGYVSAPDYVKDWVSFGENSPVTINSNSIKEVLVILQMPKKAEIFAPKWEFRITVVAQGQGKVQTAVSQRWLVTMR